GQPYALPLTRIDRVLGVPPEDVLVVEDRQYIRVDDQSIGLIDATQVLDLGTSERPAGNLHVLTLSDRLNRYGLVVDRFVGEHDLVVIPLPTRLGKCRTSVQGPFWKTARRWASSTAKTWCGLST